MGAIRKQHFLIIENLVNGFFALGVLLVGAFGANNRNVEFFIIDIKGEKYFGYEDLGVVHYASDMSGVTIPSGVTLSEEDTWFLPLMEAVWKAHKRLRGRIEKRGSQDFHPLYIVFRHYDILHKRWNRLDKEERKRLLDKWRQVYGHPRGDQVIIPRAVDDIMDEGDAVSITGIVTTASPGGATVVGLPQSTIDRMIIIIVGDAHADSGRGFWGIESSLSKGLFCFLRQDSITGMGEFVSSETNKKTLALLVALGKRYSASSRQQVALVSTSPPMVMPILCHSNGRSLKGYLSTKLAAKYLYAKRTLDIAK
jgi:hypothetical protein